MQCFRTFNWDQRGEVDLEAFISDNIFNFEMDEYYIATAGNGARSAVSTEGIQQSSRHVGSVVDFDAGRTTIAIRAEVKVEEV